MFLISNFRVGLTLKQKDGNRESFIMRNYRYLTRPCQIKKGKPAFVLKLSLEGYTPQQICSTTCTSSRVVERYLEDFNQGKKTSPDVYKGKALTTRDLCKLYGALHYSGYC